MPRELDILNDLIEEEKQAIRDYKRAIATTDKGEYREVYQHILEEEIEHLEELEALKEQPVYNTERRLKELKALNRQRILTEEEIEELAYCENEVSSREAEQRYLNGRDSSYSKPKKVEYGKPEKYDKIYFSVEGSEEGEIFDNLKSLLEAKAKIRGLKKNDKELDIEQTYTVYKHYVTKNSDFMEEVYEV